MWIVEAMDYPNERAQRRARRRSDPILEDTNGDGRADKFTVFAEHLNIPTSLVFANGGVIVAQPPHILFLKDTNGDDKADERKVLSTGWGSATRTRCCRTCSTGRDNYIWGVGRLLGLQRRDQRQADAVRRRRRSASSRTAATSKS